MPKPFAGIAQYVEAAAIARGYDPGDAKNPQMLLVSEARSSKVMTRVGDSIAQASYGPPEHKVQNVARAIDLLWMLGVMKEATEAALLEFHTEHELDVSKLMRTFDNAARHRSSDVDQRVDDDMGSSESGGAESVPRQLRGPKPRKDKSEHGLHG